MEVNEQAKLLLLGHNCMSCLHRFPKIKIIRNNEKTEYFNYHCRITNNYINNTNNICQDYYDLYRNVRHYKT